MRPAEGNDRRLLQPGAPPCAPTTGLPLRARICVLWVAAAFIFFSLTPLKRGAYLLPLRPAVALLVGWWLAEIVREAAPAGQLVPALRGVALATAGIALGGLAFVAALAHGWLPTTAVERLVPAGGEVDVETVVDRLRAAGGAGLSRQ